MRSKLRQMKAVASYRTPKARLWSAQAAKSADSGPVTRFHKTATTCFGQLPGCRARQSQLRQTKALAGYHTPRARSRNAQLQPGPVVQAESPSAHEELTLRTELVTFTTTQPAKGEASGERHSNYRRTDE